MRLAVVIPCFRVSEKILALLAEIGPEVDFIIVVDDRCDQGSGRLVEQSCHDPRVTVIHHAKNKGVGGATVTGYLAALEMGAEVLVKVDGDGQMDPALILTIAAPVLAGLADYSKGNRFFSPRSVAGMPWVRLFGNSVLSFTAKVSCGYWNIMDPTNGFTALHQAAARKVSLERLDNRYFFETDLLYRLNLCRAVVRDVPMQARYADEKSNLKIHRAAVEFPIKNFSRLIKRILYQYFVRDFSLGSILLVLGWILLLSGSGFGAYRWLQGVQGGYLNSAGTVMLAAVPCLLGVQFLLHFLYHDVGSVPREPLQVMERLLQEAITRNSGRTTEAP